MLELYAIEIQMYSDLKESKKLRVCTVPRTSPSVSADEAQEIYEASMKVKNAIPHPRIMGVIRECGGKMWMMERKLPPTVAVVDKALNFQDHGIRRRQIYSNRSGSTTSLVRHSVYRCSSTSSSPTCSWEAGSTHSTRKRLNRGPERMQTLSVSKS